MVRQEYFDFGLQILQQQPVIAVEEFEQKLFELVKPTGKELEKSKNKNQFLWQNHTHHVRSQLKKKKQIETVGKGKGKRGIIHYLGLTPAATAPRVMILDLPAKEDVKPK